MNLFSAQTEESFSYLISDYGFSKPEAEDGNWKTTFLYVKDLIGIEVELNYDNMDTYVYIMILENQKHETEYDNNPPVRRNLEELLGIEPSIKNGDSITIDQFEKGIKYKSELLKKNLDQMLKNTKIVFV